jgi:thioredoxin 1
MRYIKLLVPNIYLKGNSIMAAGIKDIEDSSFDTEVIKSDKPVVVDFWAPWCGPCKAIGPILDELVTTYGDKVKFTKCNVDDNPVTPGKFGIKAIPTLIFFKNGEVTDQITGMVAKAKLEEALNNVLS